MFGDGSPENHYTTRTHSSAQSISVSAFGDYGRNGFGDGSPRNDQ
ncbi:hypothetical protein [Bartonella sp. HY406]|nr:hypothetical protein [Bartonella sp. HY406]UXN03355.1 hypothetical protein N6B01_13060 [Bartonella sp. HY406]